MIGDIIEFGFYTLCVIGGFVIILAFPGGDPLTLLGGACIGAGLVGWVFGGAE